MLFYVSKRSHDHQRQGINAGRGRLPTLPWTHGLSPRKAGPGERWKVWGFFFSKAPLPAAPFPTQREPFGVARGSAPPFPSSFSKTGAGAALTVPRLRGNPTPRHREAETCASPGQGGKRGGGQEERQRVAVPSPLPFFLLARAIPPAACAQRTREARESSAAGFECGLPPGRKKKK